MNKKDKKTTPNMDEELLTAREEAEERVRALSLEELEGVSGGSGGAKGDERDIMESGNMSALMDDVDGWAVTQ